MMLVSANVDEMNDELATVTDAPTDEHGQAAPVFLVRVGVGPDTGQSILLDWTKKPSFLVGQSPLCDLRLTDRRASRRHLSFSPAGARIRLTDLDSTNGTRVMGLQVVSVLLSGGETVEIGETQLRIARAPVQSGVAASGWTSFGRVLGKSFDMQRVFDAASRLASSALAILIEGESGTGKELLAESIHEMGSRASGPLVTLDCATQGDSLEAAITTARHGTLVLSEIADLDEQAQLRLTKAIDQTTNEVRFIATSRRDVDRAVEQGRLREELVFRLAGARLELPPLRCRHGDVALLVAHFWQRHGGPGEPPRPLLLKLAHADWPGNVRELEHAVARAVLDTVEPIATPSTEPRVEGADLITATIERDLSLPQTRQIIMRDVERRFVEHALRKHKGNVTRAAAASGLTRRYFHLLLAATKER